MRAPFLLPACVALAACTSQPPQPEQPDQRQVCTALYAYGISITVLDAGGDSLRATPTGVLRDGSWRETMQGFGNRLMGAGERKGTYNVTVSAPGYASWDTSGVVVTADECHVQGVSLTASLRRQE